LYSETKSFTEKKTTPPHKHHSNNNGKKDKGWVTHIQNDVLYKDPSLKLDHFESIFNDNLKAKIKNDLLKPTQASLNNM